ncbi:MAG: MFS transporter, partial [Gemmatimonadaceae bacterium]
AAIGTALGPSLGGVLIAVFSWRALFFVNVPLGLLTLLLAYRTLPDNRTRIPSTVAAFDGFGTMLLAFTLASYALAMTMGRGRFGLLNISLLMVAAIGAISFVAVELRVSSPLVRLSMFRDVLLRTSLAMITLVSTVMMATLVVGPFYLARTLQLDAAMVGLTMSVGPIVAALTSVPAGRLADRFGSFRVTLAGICGVAIGALALALLPVSTGVVGYLIPLALMTAGYAVFQTANNTVLMTGVNHEQRGVIAGLLNLARNLGLISGASVMGAVFAHASGSTDISVRSATSVATGMHVTFAVATALMLAALAIGLRGRVRLK